MLLNALCIVFIDESLMNDSLTNIQWLGNMKGDTLQVVNHKDIRLVASERQIEMVLCHVS